MTVTAHQPALSDQQARLEAVCATCETSFTAAQWEDRHRAPDGSDEPYTHAGCCKKCEEGT